jgi:hypothetical protein
MKSHFPKTMVLLMFVAFMGAYLCFMQGGIGRVVADDEVRHVSGGLPCFNLKNVASPICFSGPNTGDPPCMSGGCGCGTSRLNPNNEGFQPKAASACDTSNNCTARQDLTTQSCGGN